MATASLGAADFVAQPTRRDGSSHPVRTKPLPLPAKLPSLGDSVAQELVVLIAAHPQLKLTLPATHADIRHMSRADKLSLLANIRTQLNIREPKTRHLKLAD